MTIQHRPKQVGARRSRRTCFEIGGYRGTRAGIVNAQFEEDEGAAGVFRNRAADIWAYRDSSQRWRVGCAADKRETLSVQERAQADLWPLERVWCSSGHAMGAEVTAKKNKPLCSVCGAKIAAKAEYRACECTTSCSACAEQLSQAYLRMCEDSRARELNGGFLRSAAPLSGGEMPWEVEAWEEKSDDEGWRAARVVLWSRWRFV